MKIVNFKKFLRSILIIIAIIFIITLIFSKSFSCTNTNQKTIYISEGDTLWQIANFESKTNNYYKGKDIRDIILEIKKINHLETTTVYDGQELIVNMY